MRRVLTLTAAATVGAAEPDILTLRLSDLEIVWVGCEVTVSSLKLASIVFVYVHHNYVGTVLLSSKSP